MDHWKKVYELGGRLGFVRGLFEFIANHVNYHLSERNSKTRYIRGDYL